MESFDSRIIQALEQTRVVRPPRQHLATFGSTSLRYFVVTEPVYAELTANPNPEAVMREGRIIAKRPEVVTPSYMLHLEGFGSEARRTLQLLTERFGANSPGIHYVYKNESIGLNIVGGAADGVAENIKADLDKKGDNLAVVIRGADDLWDVSLLKFIYEYTAASAASNIGDLMGRRLLDPDPAMGIPRAAVERVEDLFREVEAGNAEPARLKQELDRWGLFDRYEDRFLGLFRRRRR